MFPLKMYSIVRHKSNCVMPYGSYDMIIILVPKVKIIEAYAFRASFCRGLNAMWSSSLASVPMTTTAARHPRRLLMVIKRLLVLLRRGQGHAMVPSVSWQIHIGSTWPWPEPNMRFILLATSKFSRYVKLISVVNGLQGVPYNNLPFFRKMECGVN